MCFFDVMLVVVVNQYVFFVEGGLVVVVDIGKEGIEVNDVRVKLEVLVQWEYGCQVVGIGVEIRGGNVLYVDKGFVNVE